MSPDEVEPSIGGADDQTDAIPMSSSSDSLSLSDEVDARATLPTPSDILVSYSTFPGAFESMCVCVFCSHAYAVRTETDKCDLRLM